MKRTAALFEKMDNYINNRLEGSALSNFEKSLQSDKKLREELNKYTLITQALKDGDSIAFREKLIAIEHMLEDDNNVIDSKNASVKNFSKTYLNIAASIIILVGISLSFWIFNTQDNTVFADNYIPYPMPDIIRGETADNNGILYEIAENYRNKQYEIIIPFLEREILKEKEQELLKLYLGNCYLNTNQEDKAIRVFSSIEKETSYYDDAQWFLGMAYLKIDKKPMAADLFKKLSVYPNIYKNKSVTILKKLE